MNEKLLQFIWQHQYFNAAGLMSVQGETVEIVHPGTINRNQGPDFFNAKVRVGGMLLAGSVEIHLKTSLWLRHGHEPDPHYRNVILHVVMDHDLQIDHPIATLELNSRIPRLVLQRYESLVQSPHFIACHHSVKEVPAIIWASWKERLLAERLERKMDKIKAQLNRNQFHWEETFWQLLARNFGHRQNADLFEAMAQTLPLNLLSKHKNQIHQLEALLLGQGNLLESRFAESYPTMLQKEYRFLRKKYGLSPVHVRPVFHRMRPAGFPTIRLAQLAMLVHRSAHLFSLIVEQESIKEIRSSMQVTANDYWHYHFRFDEETAFQKKNLGTDMVDNILINTVVPVAFAYGQYHKNEKLKMKAVGWLEDLGPETNQIISGFRDLGVGSRSASDSQALLELKSQYCDLKRCLDCSIGNNILKTEARMVT